jgi:tetratricopeptide (TPR) repeat protein
VLKAVTIFQPNLIASVRLLKRLWRRGSATCAGRRIAILAVLFAILINTSDTAAQADNVLKQLEHAAALIADNRIADAEKELSSILKAAPNEPAALNLLGTIRARQGRVREAENFFLRAIRGDAKYVGPHMNLAYLYTLRGQPQNTISELREVLLLDPRNAEALDRLARLLLARGEIDEGIKALEQAERSQPLSVALLVLLGDAYLKKGNAANAEKRYQLILEEQSDNTDAVLGLAQVSQLKGDVNTALLYLARARKMVATSPDTLYRFALVAIGAGLYEEANTTLQAAVKLKPDDAAYFLALGNTWLKKPDLVDAEQAFRLALQLQPGNPRTQMYLGYTLLEQKKYPEAREWLEKSLSQDKSIPETFYYLGQLAQQQSEDERAMELFRKAIELAPSYAFAHAALGASYLRLRNYPLAQQELELSIKLDPGYAKAHYDLAVLFARLKNDQRAREEMQMVEKLKSKNTKQSNEGDVSTPSAAKPPE